jgi:hypothetical protein
MALRCASGVLASAVNHVVDFTFQAGVREQIPRTTSRAPENQGQSRNARDSARDDNVVVDGAYRVGSNITPERQDAGVKSDATGSSKTLACRPPLQRRTAKQTLRRLRLK